MGLALGLSALWPIFAFAPRLPIRVIFFARVL
jgi:hypothetical protein